MIRAASRTFIATTMETQDRSRVFVRSMRLPLRFNKPDPALHNAGPAGTRSPPAFSRGLCRPEATLAATFLPR